MTYSPNDLRRRLTFQIIFTAISGLIYLAIGHKKIRFSGVLLPMICNLRIQLDYYTPFQPWFIIVYFSFWLFWWIPSYRLTTGEFKSFLTSTFFCHLIAFACFLIC